MTRIITILFLLCISVTQIKAQSKDSTVIRTIYSFSLEKGNAYAWLDYLSNKIGGRLSGSAQADKAVIWAKGVMDSLHPDTAYLQDVMVPHWVRGAKEVAIINSKTGQTPISVCALGGSIATPAQGIKANVIEIHSFDEMAALGKSKIEGKIVFYNVPMDQKHIHTFEAYGETGKYRWAGAQKAQPFGAIACINRSLTLAMDDNPHTGAMGYNDTIPKIPAAAVSTMGAEELSKALKSDPNLQLELKMSCETLPDKPSDNVIGEIRGSEFPDEIIVVGGHLDSWDTGHGAHDDGAGVVQSLEVLQIFKALGIQPKRTIRVVLYINEENGLRGGKKYAEVAKSKNEKTIAAIETDEGGFTPQGFSSEGDSLQRISIRKWKNLFQPYGLFEWEEEGDGADISTLKDQGTLLIGLQPDSQRYFDYHHTPIDTFDKVNRRELELGSAAIASLAYLISEYGLK